MLILATSDDMNEWMDDGHHYNVFHLKDFRYALTLRSMTLQCQKIGVDMPIYCTNLQISTLCFPIFGYIFFFVRGE